MVIAIGLLLVQFFPIWPGYIMGAAMITSLSDMSTNLYFFFEMSYFYLIILLGIVGIFVVFPFKNFHLPKITWLFYGLLLAIYPAFGLYLLSTNVISEYFWTGAGGFIASLILAGILAIHGIRNMDNQISI